MRSAASILLLTLLVCPGVTHSAQQTGTLTNQDVLSMLKAGLAADIIVAKIKASDCNFDTNPNTLTELKKASVPDAVILAMVQARNTVNGQDVYVKCTPSEAKWFLRATSDYNSSNVAEVRCGDALKSLGKEGFYAKVRTQQGVVGYIMEDFLSSKRPEVSSATPSPSPSPVSTNTAQSHRLPSGMLRAIAWRAVPWATTSYWQQPGTANTQCTGSGSWMGSIWQGNASCTTQYTPAQTIPLNWQHYTIYDLVETADSLMVVACTRNWAWSKCGPLIPGDTFEFENNNGRISVKGHRSGKNKEQSLDLDIVSTQQIERESRMRSASDNHLLDARVEADLRKIVSYCQTHPTNGSFIDMQGKVHDCHLDYGNPFNQKLSEKE